MAGVTAKQTLGAPAHVWQKLEVLVPADKMAAPSKSMTVVLTGPGEFDTLVVQEQLPDSPNLAANSSFETAVNALEPRLQS